MQRQALRKKKIPFFLFFYLNGNFRSKAFIQKGLIVQEYTHNSARRAEIEERNPSPTTGQALKIPRTKL